MKFPSLQKLTQATVEVLFRFPLEIFCATVGTGLLLWQTEQTDPNDEVIRVIMCCVLGLVLFLSVTVFSESQRPSKRQRSLLQASAVVVLALCWFSIRPIENETSIIRYALFSAAFHLLVSFAPKANIDGFWEYNKQLFLRILLAQLYSWVLFAGLAIAVATSDFLFTIDFDHKIYLRTFIIIMGLFNTVFFLAGVPRDFNSTQTYPKGLKIFTQYVLIPLATIYLTIILAYEGKVIVEWVLPKGIISWLILGYAVYGILSILLVYPVRKQEENKWISTYSRLFYLLLIPLLPLLCFAIGVRVLDYGITEPRYIVLILAVWLTGITLYFLVSKKQNIKVIPISLCLVALLSAWGPQSASSVSQRSQLTRLIDLFDEQDRFKEGKLQPMPETVADSIGSQILEQLRFLTDKYGAAPLVSVLPQILTDSLLHVDTIKNVYTKRQRAYEIIRNGLALKTYYTTNPNEYYYYQAVLEKRVIPISGYSYVKDIQFYNNDYDTIQELVIKNEELRWQTKDDTAHFNLSTLLNSIEEVAESTKETYQMDKPIETMTVLSTKGEVKKLIVRRISVSRYSEERDVTEIDGLILIRN